MKQQPLTTALQVLGVLSFMVAFLLPLRLDALLYESPLRGMLGLSEYYAASFIYLPEIVLLCAGAWALLVGPQQSSKNAPPRLSLWFALSYLLLLAAGLISTMVAQDVTLHLLLLRLFLYLPVLWWLLKLPIARKGLVYGLLVGALAQFPLALYQVIMGSSLGLHIIGEPALHVSYLTSSTYVFGDVEILRAYGTFDHPNILGGFTLLSLLLGLQFWSTEQKATVSHPWFRRFAILVLALTVLLTGSKLVIALLFISGMIFAAMRFDHPKHRFLSYILAAVGLVFVASLFVISGQDMIQDRLVGMLGALQNVLHAPMGTGLGLSSIAPSLLPHQLLAPWDFQPAHVSTFVLLVELGILGALAYLSLLCSSLARSWKLTASYGAFSFMIVLSLILLGLIDHYVVTQFPTIILSFLVLLFPFTYTEAA